MKPVRDFHFKEFTVSQEKSTHKVGTDGVLLGAWVDISGSKFILDIGTGTGVIALMLAQRTDDDVIIAAIELQDEDAGQAKSNFERSPWKDRLRLHHRPVQDYVAGYQFDLIVSNPPYFSNGFPPPAEKRGIVRHDEQLTFGELLDCVKRLLNPKGRFSLVLPVAEGSRFIEMAKTKDLHCSRMCEFKTRKNKPTERLLLEFSFQEVDMLREELLLYKEGDEWSDGYKALTRDFYLKI